MSVKCETREASLSDWSMPLKLGWLHGLDGYEPTLARAVTGLLSALATAVVPATASAYGPDAVVRERHIRYAEERYIPPRAALELLYRAMVSADRIVEEMEHEMRLRVPRRPHMRAFVERVAHVRNPRDLEHAWESIIEWIRQEGSAYSPDLHEFVRWYIRR